jgi:hypothetical protein
LLSPVEYIEQDCGYETPCWVWQRSKMGNGYGCCRVDGVLTAAHRVYYERFVGSIPDGLDLDHLCRVRACVNPAHLEPVTRAENLRRGSTTKLTVLAVREIKRALDPTPQDVRRLAAKFGVSVRAITSVLAGSSWVDVQ